MEGGSLSRTCTMSRVRPMDFPKQLSQTTQPLQGAR